MLIAPLELIKESLALYKKNWQRLWTYVLCIFLTLAAFQAFGFAFVRWIGPMADTAAVNMLLSLLFFALIILVALINFWIGLAVIRTVADAYEEKPILAVKDELMAVRFAILPAIGASLLAGLAVFGGMILFIIPGIIFMVWFAFSTYAIILDKHGAMESLRMSKALVKGRWWEAFSRMAIPALVFIFAAIILQGIIAIPIGFLLTMIEEGTIAFTLVSSLLTIIMLLFGALLTPLASAVSTILYLELKRTRPPRETSAG